MRAVVFVEKKMNADWMKVITKKHQKMCVQIMYGEKKMQNLVTKFKLNKRKLKRLSNICTT